MAKTQLLPLDLGYKSGPYSKTWKSDTQAGQSETHL